MIIILVSLKIVSNSYLLFTYKHFSDSLTAKAKEYEDYEAHPGIEYGEDRVKVSHLPSWELDESWICKQPHHDKQEICYGKALPLCLNKLLRLSG